MLSNIALVKALNVELRLWKPRRAYLRGKYAKRAWKLMLTAKSGSQGHISLLRTSLQTSQTLRNEERSMVKAVIKLLW